MECQNSRATDLEHLLLTVVDLPSEFVGENLVHVKSMPLNIKAKSPAAGNFSLKQMIEVNFSLKV